MKCPSCGRMDAYHGLTFIDCINPSCKYFGGLEAGPDLSPDPITQNPSGSATGIASRCSVTIKSQLVKRSSVEIKFIASGDPGMPDKKVEFLWSVAGMQIPSICTLSSRQQYFVEGVDANSQTTYTTNWRCTLDGVSPTSPWTLSCRIYK